MDLQLDIKEMLCIIGEQRVQLHMQKKRIAELEATIKKMQDAKDNDTAIHHD